MDHRATEWQAASCMADLANYAEHCRHSAFEAITKHNEHIEVCNRVIESAETGRPVPPTGDGEDNKLTIDHLRKELNDKTSDNRRLETELAAEKNKLRGLIARVEELEHANERRTTPVGPNADLVQRLNAVTSELQTVRAENDRLRKAHAHAAGGDGAR
jgi:hypothetical protein